MVLHQVNNEVVEQFDSAGKQPKRDIVNNLFSNALSYKYNNKRVQNLSDRYMWIILFVL